jgi:hypothetical protein
VRERIANLVTHIASLQRVDGRDIASHGDREMPVWGDAFRTTRGGLSPEAVKARIDALVRYLEALQEKAAN